MRTILITTGIACVIGAIIGGGFRGFGVELPPIPSWRVRTALGLLGAVLLGAGFFYDPDSGAENAMTAKATCDSVPKLMLNEICAEGKECDGRQDFVEIYNPSDSSADLSCYAIIDQKQHRKGLSGILRARTVQAWTASQLGFGLSRDNDRVSLVRMRRDGTEQVDDARDITEKMAYQQRIPNGGDHWEVASHQQVKAAGKVGSRNGDNRSLPAR